MYVAVADRLFPSGWNKGSRFWLTSFGNQWGQSHSLGAVTIDHHCFRCNFVACPSEIQTHQAEENEEVLRVNDKSDCVENIVFDRRLVIVGCLCCPSRTTGSPGGSTRSRTTRGRATCCSTRGPVRRCSPERRSRDPWQCQHPRPRHLEPIHPWYIYPARDEPEHDGTPLHVELRDGPD